jgi:glycosyltransferase involved in cell wall biosynthesis
MNLHKIAVNINFIRVAMVVFSYYPDDPRVLREAEALLENGMAVDVICLKREDQRKKEQINGANVYRIKLKRRRATILHYLFEYSYFTIAVFLKLFFLHLIKRYKIIHVHTLPDILVLSAFLPKLTGAKVILDIHDIMPELYMRKYRLSESHIMIRLIKACEKISVKFADHVLLASPFFKEKVIIRSSCADKFTTIMNLPHTKYFDIKTSRYCHNDTKFKVIYPGTLSEIHGVDIAIKAIARIINDNNIGIEFHIYGQGAQREKNKLIKLIEMLQVQRFIHFHPPVPADKLGSIYRSMDVGIVPKRNGVFAEDAMSTKLFEFAAVGLPAIVSRTKSDSLYFDESMVMFFEPEEDQDLADCIIKLYQDSELRQVLAQNARLLYRRVNWETEKKVLFKVYERIL